ncbi:MAG: GNAT family N-acetyltransferase [bacterium]|nr:GNAT family N-acetyltransferase [bacterium]
MIHQGPTSVGDGELTAREIRPDDAGLLYRLRMDPQTRPMFRHTEGVPFGDHERFLERYFAADNTDCWFVVEVSGQPVGSMALVGLDPQRGEGETGRLIVAPEHRGRGYARRAMQLLIRFAAEIGLSRLRGEVLEANVVQRRNLAGLGYRETGTFTSGDRRFVEVRLPLVAP